MRSRSGSVHSDVWPVPLSPKKKGARCLRRVGRRVHEQPLFCQRQRTTGHEGHVVHHHREYALLYLARALRPGWLFHHARRKPTPRSRCSFVRGNGHDMFCITIAWKANEANELHVHLAPPDVDAENRLVGPEAKASGSANSCIPRLPRGLQGHALAHKAGRCVAEATHLRQNGPARKVTTKA